LITSLGVQQTSFRSQDSNWPVGYCPDDPDFQVAVMVGVRGDYVSPLLPLALVQAFAGTEVLKAL
jgi:hypothetical protein